MNTNLHARRATANDVEGIRKLCAEMSGSRATLGASRRDRIDPREWVTAHVPAAVVDDGGRLIAFAAALAQNVPMGAAKCAETLVFVSASHRRCGAGRAALGELLMIARASALWKLVAFALPEDAAAKALCSLMEFREVGVMVKHLQIEGSWHDVAMYEKLVMAARKSRPSVSEL